MLCVSLKHSDKDISEKGSALMKKKYSNVAAFMVEIITEDILNETAMQLLMSTK